jgi:hypothetical protein
VQFNTHEYIYPIYVNIHLILSDHNWLKVAETLEIKNVDKSYNWTLKLNDMSKYVI